MTDDRGVINRVSEQFRLIVDLDAVRAALNAPLDLVQTVHGRWLSFAYDFYWDVLDSELTERATEPAVGLASLVDDYNEGGLLHVRLTFLSRDEVSREGCRYAEEVPAGVQA
jgi:hypothetical protein